MTSPSERTTRPGWENKVPRTSDEFAQVWQQSQARQQLMEDIEEYIARHPFHSEDYHNFLTRRRMDQSNNQRQKSPYTLSYLGQIRLTAWRSYIMLRTDPSLTATMLITNVIESLIISSVFYNLDDTTNSFDKRALLMFFSILMNAFGSILEIITLYAKRKIIEKHKRYAFYHPSAEALSSIVIDLPYKIVNALCVNLTLYFMTNLRREPGPFFFFFLISFTTTLTMSMLFRLIASTTKSIAQALAPSSILLLVLTLYTGYAIPIPYMRGWIAWVRWLNPIFYSLESATLNEFVGRNFTCSSFVPQGGNYDLADSTSKSCAVQGSIAGDDFVSGESYLLTAFGYQNSHRWRNFGILVVFIIGYMALHLMATEYVASERSKGEVLVFTRDALSRQRRNQQNPKGDIETGRIVNTQRGVVSTAEMTEEKTENVEKQTSIFHWQNVCYDIMIKGEQRRILDHVDGWVKPGTLTALMVRPSASCHSS